MVMITIKCNSIHELEVLLLLRIRGIYAIGVAISSCFHPTFRFPFAVAGKPKCSICPSTDACYSRLIGPMTPPPAGLSFQVGVPSTEVFPYCPKCQSGGRTAASCHCCCGSESILTMFSGTPSLQWPFATRALLTPLAG